MQLFGRIELDDEDCVVELLNEQDEAAFRQRLPKQLDEILDALKPYRRRLSGLVVVSSYDWLWLVDGLIDAGYRVHLKIFWRSSPLHVATPFPKAQPVLAEA